MRSPAGKPAGKASKTPAPSGAARKPAVTVAEVARPRTALAAAKPAKPTLRHVETVPPAAVPPPLPAPIASFTF
ncbi:MAG TPA: hypothetical protein VHM31_16775 [Polyangia bacterium]|nr:hypothetical protein [Polyangia bacterium]